MDLVLAASKALTGTLAGLVGIWSPGFWGPMALQECVAKCRGYAGVR
jgi:hypothetical protein